MNIKNRIEQIILSKSNSYKFYKDYYDKHIEDKSVEEQFKEIKEEYLILRTNTWGYMNSSHYLLKTILVDYELNEPKNILKYIHELSNELLILISNICEKYGLDWWLDSSSLLGAVRHENFIPWDDEVDIGMLRKDYIEFIKLIKDEINKIGLNNIVYVDFKTHENTGNESNSFLKLIVKRETLINDESTLAVLNIFPYDFIENFDEKTLKNDYITSKRNYFNNIDSDNCLEKYYSELNLTYKKTDYIIQGVDGKYSKKNSDIFLIETNKIFPLKQVKFGENQFNAPNDINKYLQLKYDDYLVIPKLISIHHHVDSLRYNSNNEEIFEECLIKLQNINSNFNQGLYYEE